MAKRKKSTFERLQSKRLNRQQRKQLQRQFDAEAPETDDRASSRSRYRYRERESLCGGTTGPGSGAGTRVRKLDGGFASHGAMVEILRGKNRSHAVHRSVVDCSLRCAGTGRVRGLSGKCL